MKKSFAPLLAGLDMKLSWYTKCDSERQDKLKDTIITESFGLSIHCVGKFDTQKRQSRAEWWGGDMRA